MKRNFHKLLLARVALECIVSVGLDPDIDKIANQMKRRGNESDARYKLRYCKHVVDQAMMAEGSDGPLCFKPNWAFFVEDGWQGMKALEELIEYIRAVASEVPVIADMKVGDIGNTNKGYVRLAYEILNVDAITVHGYMGRVDGMQLFLDDPNKGVIVLCRTTNSGGAEFQDFKGRTKKYKMPDGSIQHFASKRHARIELGDDFKRSRLSKGAKMRMYQYVAHRISASWNANGNVYLVVGANNPKEAKRIRKIVGDMFFLAPGLGAQGGKAESMMAMLTIELCHGVMAHQSRGVMYPKDGETVLDALVRIAGELNSVRERFRVALAA